QVTVVEMLPQVLPVEDQEIAKNLEKILVKRGMTIKTGAAVEDVKVSGKTLTATIRQGDSREKWSGDCGLIAIGIVPNSDGIGLDKVGITTNARGHIEVDEFLRTNVPHHYAIGDIVPGPALAHKASHEGV